MKPRLYLALCAIMSLLALAGCGTTTNVVGGCEIPTTYDVVKTVPGPLPPNTTVKQFAEAATAERSQHKQDVDDFNGLHDYVRDNCK